MKRLLAALLALLIPTALVFGALWLTSQPGLPDQARARLNEYLHGQFTRASRVYRVQRIARADRPWNFTASMSGATFGDSVHYQTTDSPAAPMPLPYPPRELWCVWLGGVTTASISNSRLAATSSGGAEHHAQILAARHRPGTSGDTRLVFVALHEDLYNADWIVHELRQDIQTGDELGGLAVVGCAMSR